MDKILLIKLGVGLIVLLAFLMFILFYSTRRAKAKKEEQSNIDNSSIIQNTKTDLNSLYKIIKNKNTPSKELKETLDLILKDYGVIKDFDIYADILFTICIHPNTKTKIIISFDKELSKLNPEYKTKINSAITKGLDAR